MPLHHNHSKPKTVYHSYDSMDLDGKFNIKALNFCSEGSYSPDVKKFTEFKNEHLEKGDLHSVRLFYDKDRKPILTFTFGHNYHEGFEVECVKEKEHKPADIDKVLEGLVNDITNEIAISKGERIAQTDEQALEATNYFEDAFNSLKSFVGKITDNKKPVKEEFKSPNQNIPTKVEEGPSFSPMEHSKEGDFGA